MAKSGSQAPDLATGLAPGEAQLRHSRRAQGLDPITGLPLGIKLPPEASNVGVLTLLVMASSPECTVKVPHYCGAVSTQWVAVRLDGGIKTFGRCDMHPAQDSVRILERTGYQGPIVTLAKNASGSYEFR